MAKERFLWSELPIFSNLWSLLTLSLSCSLFPPLPLGDATFE